MRAYAKVNIVTKEKVVKTGERINLSPENLQDLKEQGFVAVDDEAMDIETIDIADDMETVEVLSEEEIRKISKKADLVAYAEQIGLKLDESLSKNELVDSILNYIQENAAEIE